MKVTAAMLKGWTWGKGDRKDILMSPNGMIHIVCRGLSIRRTDPGSNKSHPVREAQVWTGRLGEGLDKLSGGYVVGGCTRMEAACHALSNWVNSPGYQILPSETYADGLHPELTRMLEEGAAKVAYRRARSEVTALTLELRDLRQVEETLDRVVASREKEMLTKNRVATQLQAAWEDKRHSLMRRKVGDE